MLWPGDRERVDRVGSCIAGDHDEARDVVVQATPAPTGSRQLVGSAASSSHLELPQDPATRPRSGLA